MDATVAIACLLTDNELQQRRSEHLDRAASHLTPTRELEDRFEFNFCLTDDTVYPLAGIADLERKYCPFLDFALTVRSGADGVNLSITDPEEAKEAVRSLFGWNRTSTPPVEPR
jgi:hypothetical protein